MRRELVLQDPAEHMRMPVPEGHVSYDTIVITMRNVFGKNYDGTLRTLLPELESLGVVSVTHVPFGSKTRKYYKCALKEVAEKLAEQKGLSPEAVKKYFDRA